MATVTRDECDVFGGIDDVFKVHVVVSTKAKGDTEFTFRFNEMKDMCPRAFDRLLRLIDRGTTPPSKKTAADKPEPDETG